MSRARTIHHTLQCFDPVEASWLALCEAPFPHKTLFGWAPGATYGADPPEPVRRALWEALQAAGGGLVGFVAGRDATGPGSLWRDTSQGWLARRLRPLPGIVWTSDPETFDAAFGPDWVRGCQVIYALGVDAKVPRLDEALLAPWLAAAARTAPPIPLGATLAVRAGANGALFAGFARSRVVLERFVDGFRQGLDWRTTTFQRLLEPQMAPTLARLQNARSPEEPTSTTLAGAPAAAGDRPRWFAATLETRRPA